MDRYTAKKLTKLKRQSQTCKVYEVKVDRSHLSQDALKHLTKLFTEAKWFYNYCLGQDDVNNSDTKAKAVPVKVKDAFEERTLNVLAAQMKQSIKTRLFNSISSLKALKKNGRRVGKLKFKSEINSIPLVQYNKTFFIDKENSKVGLQGWKPWIRVIGLEQIPPEAEIACATLVRKVNDYYFKITTYTTMVSKVVHNASTGIDFGCQTQMTFSDGTKVEFQVPPTKRLRRLDRKIMKVGRTDSKKKRQDRDKRRKEYEKTTNKKKDIKNKIVNAVTTHFKYVCFQNESIHAWHAGRHGKKIQHSGIGGIISDLKHKSVTPLEVAKFFPSTKMCPNCGQLNKLSLADRIFNCECGYSKDRDWKSAICIETEGLKQIPVDDRKLTVQENRSSAFFDKLSKINNIKVSKVSS